MKELYLVVRPLPALLKRLHESLLLVRHHRVHDHRGASGKGSLGALVEVINSLGSKAWPLEVNIHINSTGYDELASSIYGSGAAWYDKMVAHQSDNSILEI